MSVYQVEVRLTGPVGVLDEIEREMGLRRAPFHSDFSLERLVPITHDRLATHEERTRVATRIRDEVLDPWRRLVAEETDLPEVREALEQQLGWVVIRACESLVPVVGTPEGVTPSRWLLEKWGSDADVDTDHYQRPLSDEQDSEVIHVALGFPPEVTTPPLTAFDELARHWPAVEMTVLWDGGANVYLPSGCGMATWRHGVRVDATACDDRDRSERFGNLHSLAPLRLAHEIRDAGLGASEVRPHVRVDLTHAEFVALHEGESIELELGPDLNVSVGSGADADFFIPGRRLTGFDYCDGRGIEYDEAWHRIPGSVLGLQFVLTLHSTDSMEINRAETILRRGSDPLLDWVREFRRI